MGLNSGRGDYPINSVWVNRRGLPSPITRAVFNQAAGSAMQMIMVDWYFGQADAPPPAGSETFILTRMTMGMGM